MTLKRLNISDEAVDAETAPTGNVRESRRSSELNVSLKRALLGHERQQFAVDAAAGVQLAG